MINLEHNQADDDRIRKMMGWPAVNCCQMEQRLSSSPLQAETDPITGIQQEKPCDSGPHSAVSRLR